MSNKVIEGIQSSNLTFLKLHKRQNVSKTKLEEEFLQKAWNTCSAGFGGNNLVCKEKIKTKLNLKSDDTSGCLSSFEKTSQTLHRRLLGTDYKAVKRKSMLEIGNIDTDFFPPATKNSCPAAHSLNSAQFLDCLKKDSKDQKVKQKLDILFVTKKLKNPAFHIIENPFKDIANVSIKSSVKECTKLNMTVPQVQSVEQENVHRKRKVPDGSFIDPSLNFLPPPIVNDVLKKSLVPSCVRSSLDAASVPEIDCSKKIKKCTSPPRINQSEDMHSSSLMYSHDKSFLANNSKVYLSNSTDSKGTNWVQSLQWTPSEQEDSGQQNRSKKKKLQNALPGGYAEQLLKLQRREQSEKIFWQHEMDKNKEKDTKAEKNTLLMCITAISYVGNFVTVKATCLNFPTSLQAAENNYVNKPEVLDSALLSKALIPDEMINCDATSNSPKDKLYLVLFKKAHFIQYHLKVKNSFRLHPPWQILKSAPYTIILCPYFVECFHTPENHCPEESLSVISITEHTSIPSTQSLSYTVTHDPQYSTSLKDLIFRWGESISLYGRVQRIWYHQVHLPEHFPKDIKHYRFSLLLQEQSGIFFEVIFTTRSSLQDEWLHFMMSAEGKCFGFPNLRLSHRLPLKKHIPFLKFLEAFPYQQNVGEQEFVWQLLFDINYKVPEEVNSDNYPPYYQVQVESMSKLLKDSTVQRISFLGNVLFQHENVFFMSDESLLHEPLTKYFQLQLLFPFETKTLILGSTVFVREALFSGGYFVLDKYSHFTVLSGSSCTPHNLAGLGENKLNQLTLVKLQNIIKPLRSHSKAGYIVSIEGVITSVDENSAFSLMQCCFCLQENLVQDRNLVIYCEDCLQIVPKPILKIKMEVSVSCQGLDSVVNVQLLSATTKKILEISDDVEQPHCRVADVLGRSIGPLFCYIQSCDSTDNKQMFYLSEIQSS